MGEDQSLKLTHAQPACETFLVTPPASQASSPSHSPFLAMAQDLYLPLLLPF